MLSLSRSNLRRRTADYFCSVEHRIRSQVRWPRGQQLLFAVNQVRGVERRQLKSVPVRNRIRRTCLDTVSAKDTAVVINVVNLGVALGAADPILRRVLGGFDIDAIGRAVGRTKKARHAFLEAVFIALQDVHAPVAFLKSGATQRSRSVGIILHHRRLEHLLESNAHSLGNGGDVLEKRHTGLV
jgi:hypothetical protein